MQKHPQSDTLPSIDLDKDSIDQLRSLFEAILIQENIPANTVITKNFNSIYLPLAQWIANQHQKQAVIIGINGSQGSGKSTLSKILVQLLEQGFQKKTVTLSIDDLYKTKQQRQQMSDEIHPLFKTRGVPGTHDVNLGVSVLSQIKQQQFPINLPRFNKANDDRELEKDWPIIDQTIDIILLEGWCIGAAAQDSSLLKTAINSLEKENDKDLIWRKYINQELTNDYQELFSLIDKLIMLKIPSFDNVFEWRALQELKLKESSANNMTEKTMSSQELEYFIMHFERITRHCLKEMPGRANVILEVGHDHQIKKSIFK